jgi:chromosome segregation ATPase
MISVATILGMKRADFAERVDELAQRIVDGEKVGRDELAAFIQRIEVAPEDLQVAVDRLTRRAELLQTVRDSTPSRKRLEGIRQEFAALQAELDNAVARLDGLRAKYAVQLIDLEQTVRAADAAAAALIEPRNLPQADAERLRAARAAVDEASGEIDAARREVRDLRIHADDAERILAEERSTLTLNGDSDLAKEQVARAEMAAATRAKRLRDAEANLPKMEKKLAVARRDRDRVQAEIRSRYGAA